MRTQSRFRASVRQSLPLPLATLLVLSAFACSSAGPRIIEVASRVRLQDIDIVDQRLFVEDPASGLTYLPHDLPAGAQRQEFYVRWMPSTADSVRFEYRQVDKPNAIGRQTYTPHSNNATLFVIGGEEFRSGGPVSAWRVSLWNGGQLLAEKKSALW